MTKEETMEFLRQTCIKCMHTQKKYNANKVIVIYPLNTEMKETVTFISDDGVEVNLFFIDLNNTDQSINKLISLI